MYQLPALPFHVEVAASVEVAAKVEPANGEADKSPYKRRNWLDFRENFTT
jgi:hypothetical protein